MGSDKRTLTSVVGRPALLACLLVGIACSGGGQGDADDASNDDGSRASDDDEAGATDAETAQPDIEELLVRYDSVVNQIVADPEIAGNADDPLVHEYLGLYEPGSETARQLVDVWADRAADGLSTRPIEPDQPASLTRLDGDIEVRSDDEVAFPACIELRLEVVDGQGRVTQRTPYREQQGNGVAVQIDGEWLLRDLVVRNNTASCLTGTGGPEQTQETEQTEDS